MSESAVAPPGKRLAITITVMAAMLMQVLDSTIANVALPHMQASLGATQEQVAWVLTSYIIALAVATPVTGWLESRFGRRKLFFVAVVGFTLASMACGAAPTLETMVAARLCQGLFGAFIGPLTQASMLDTYPREKHAMALTIWGMGVMIGPIMGPVVGGWLTDSFNWRWIFFINVPIGIVVAIALWLLLSPGRLERRRFDFVGFGLISVMLISFQLMLDRGTQLDWFDSPEIIIEAGLALIALWMFAIHTLTARDPLIPTGLFRDRNFMMSNLFMMVASGVMIAGAALAAPMLQNLMGHSTYDAGLLLAPRGLAMMAAMLIAGRTVERIDARLLIGGGLALIAVSQYLMTGFNLQMGSDFVVLTGVLQGFGIGIIILPLNLLAFATLPDRLRTEGAALYNLSRSLGSSVAISVMTALVARNLQVSHQDMSAHVTAVTLPFMDAGLTERMGIEGEAALRMLDLEINRQALMIAYINDFWVMGWAAAVMVPFVLLLRVTRGSATPRPVMTE